MFLFTTYYWIGILLSASSISSYIETRVLTFINSLIQLEMSIKYLLQAIYYLS